jgi:hypothetical protein
MGGTCTFYVVDADNLCLSSQLEMLYDFLMASTQFVFAAVTGTFTCASLQTVFIVLSHGRSLLVLVMVGIRLTVQYFSFFKRTMDNWSGHILRRKSLLKHVEGKVEG